ncbi:corticosteroid-binding globulin-like [Psammomys obesus]|uniref:corticosteroid-binding globulin-like n=1 Tax=Psammomys obesus TaxID=48139 RepID=UPI0024535E8C|nr:corticosteroid-binding globulin-like [Psammomys obesus]
MPVVLYTCLLWLSISGLSTAKNHNSFTDESSRSPHRGLAPINTDFAFNLYNRLVNLNPNKNILVSPVSISMALAMLSLGPGDQTGTRLLQGLGFNFTEASEAEIHQDFQHLSRLLSQSDMSSSMSLGNIMFFDQNLKLEDSFLAAIKHYYGSEAFAIDFKNWTQASQQINTYVERKTQGKIMQVFSDPSDLAPFMLLNYIFFKGMWEFPFSPENTREEDFYVNETTTVKVPMMVQSGLMSYLHDSVIPCQLVLMDFVGNGTIFFILPDQDQMETVTAALSRDTIKRWDMLLTKRQVNLHIPKFSMSDTHDLKEVLAEVGIVDLFTGQSNFSGHTQHDSKASKVIHKAMLHLDENGVEPVATKRASRFGRSEELNINFNRPFIMLIYDDFTWSSMLMGQIMKPA